MNEVIRAIKERRSVRSFSEKLIPIDALEEIIDCARCAPSARNTQAWHFSIITNARLIKKLASAVGAKLGNAGYDFYRPTALIICSAQSDYPFGRVDCACAMENIFLSAYSLGLGSVWINQLGDICGSPEIRAVLTECGVPEGNVVCSTAALGYPSVNLAQRPEKKKLKEIVNIIR
ncbi:MAG: nitroreductase family protein [Eubacteriales bacterium]